MKLLSDVSTVAWSPDGLVTAAQDSLMVVTADGTRPLLRSLLRGEYTSEFPRLCSQSAGDGAVWVQYQSETGHGSKLLLRTTRSSVVHELHAGLFHEGFGRRVFDVAHLSKEKYIVATDCCVFVAHLSSESVQEIFAPRMM